MFKNASFKLKNVVVIVSIAAIFSLTLPIFAAPSAAADNWKQDWERMSATAKKEGKIVIYGQIGPELRVVLTKVLKDELGLDLELVPGKGREVLTRFTAETKAGLPSADIMLAGASSFRPDPDVYASWEKLEPLLILPEVLQSQAWPNGKLPFLDAEKKLIPIVLQMNQYVVVNTSIVKQGQIRSYADLLQPQWKGKIVMYDPAAGGGSLDWVTQILTKTYGLVEGEAFLRRFAAQEPVLTRDSRQQIEWVARGRYPVTIGIDTQAAYNMQKIGAPIARLATEEGGLLSGGGGYLVMPAKRPHPQAASTVLNWLLTSRGQEVFSRGYGAPAARLGIKNEGISPMALPQPGEKYNVQDEEAVLFTERSIGIAKRVFAPLLK